MKKRVICFGIVLVMVCSLFVGCGKKENSGDNVLTVGIPQNAQITSYDENGLTEHIEETLGVDIEFVYFSNSASSYLQQLALMAAGGDEFPDVLWGFQGMDNGTRNDYGEDGFFLDLTDLIDKYGTNYKAQYENLTKEEKSRIQSRGTSDDGAMYGMPLLADTAIDDVQSMMFINQKWLDAVGMKAPTNLDELYAVLKAFKEQDPNGNGKADEIPMFGNMGTNVNLCNYIINAFVYYDFSNPFNVEADGKLSFPAISDEYRQAITYMNQLCKEGLFSDLSFSVNSTTEIKSMVTPSNGTSIVGIWVGHPSLYADTTNSVMNEYAALAPLGDATGKGGYNVIWEEGLTFCSMITKDCENTELAIKFLDLFYSDEMVTRARHGVKDIDWKVADAAGKDCYGNETSIEIVNGQAFFSGNSTWGLMGNAIFTPQNYNQIDEREDSWASQVWNVMQNSRVPDKVAVNLKYTSDEYETKTDCQSLINDYILEQRDIFIVGTQNPSDDTVWQTYIENLEKLGLSTLMEVAQSAYDRTAAE